MGLGVDSRTVKRPKRLGEGMPARARHSVARIRRRARAMSSDDLARESDDADARARARPSGSTHRKRTESRYLSAEADVFAHLTPTDASSTSLENCLGEPSPSGTSDTTVGGFHSPLTSPRGLVGGDDAGERKKQWSEDASASGAMEPNDLVENSPSASRHRGDRGSTRMGGTSENAVGQSGTLKIRDQDTGREFVMSKKDASALLTAHHSGRQVVQDGSTGAKLTVDEFGARAGLPTRAPAVAVQVRGGSSKSFDSLHRIQTLRSQEGAIWTMSLNTDGTFLAAAGQDRVVRVWKSLGATARRGEKLFEETPIQEYTGHRGDILDLCWSHTNWLLSSSMDKTVRLWYTTMSECLRIFTHQDFVTSICFNPVNDKYFISGSLDGKLRMWNIPDLKVVDWVDVGEMVTSCMCAPDGKRAVAGTHKGKCLSYGMDGFKFEYLHDIQVKNTRSSKPVARKITGIDFQRDDAENMLITVNDSRLRVYDSSGKLDCKYKGHLNQNAQIRASYSSNGRFIVSGSEQPDVYIWHTDTAKTTQCGCGASTVAKQSGYEKFSTGEQHVTVALFAPDDVRATRAFPLEELTDAKGEIIIAAGYLGQISVYENI